MSAVVSIHARRCQHFECRRARADELSRKSHRLYKQGRPRESLLLTFAAIDCHSGWVLCRRKPQDRQRALLS